MTLNPRLIASILAAATAAACQTAPAANSGYLTTYDGLKAPGGVRTSSVQQRRDDAASDGVTRVFLEPAVLAPGVGDGFTLTERLLVLQEVDRQICWEVSERFEIAPEPAPDAATVRTAVVGLKATGRVGSALSTAAGFFVPIINLRAPFTTGGLAAESELLEAGTRRQIAAISWARNAQLVGMDSASFSRVGDALQMAEPLGDAVGDAFSSDARPVKEIPEPDPCLAFGPRETDGAAGFATGLTGSGPGSL